METEVGALRAEVDRLQETAITTENVGDVIGTAIADWGGDIVQLGAQLMADLREEMQSAITEAISSAVGDTLGGILPSLGKESE